MLKRSEKGEPRQLLGMIPREAQTRYDMFLALAKPFTYIISARLKSLPPPFNNQGRARQLFPPQARSHSANLIRSKLSSEKRMRQHLVPRLHNPCKKVTKICTMPRLHQERMLGLTLLLPNLMVLCIPWRSQTNGFVDLHDQGLLLQLRQMWHHGRRLMAGDMILKPRDLIGLEVVGGGFFVR
jgi:hypothetical protein